MKKKIEVKKISINEKLIYFKYEHDLVEIKSRYNTIVLTGEKMSCCGLFGSDFLIECFLYKKQNKIMLKFKETFIEIKNVDQFRFLKGGIDSENNCYD